MKQIIALGCSKILNQFDSLMAKKTGYENISVFACFLGQDYEKLYGEPDITPFTETIQKYKTNGKR